MAKDELSQFDTSMFDDFDAKAVIERVGSTLDTTGLQPTRKKPLTEGQRFVLKNFFDTQPERRRQYMKEIGFELDKEGEGYRMLGDKMSGYEPIDPGLSAYFKPGGLKELKRDATDLSFDLGVAGPLEAMGAVKGGAIGTAAGTAVPVVGNIAGGVAGTMAGAAGGYYVSEMGKTFIADILTDTDIPLDNRELFIGSVMSGGFAGLGKFMKYAGSFLTKKNGKAVKEAFSEAIKNSTTGEVSEEMMSQIFANPEKFSKEAAENGTKNLLKIADDIFGTGPDVARSTSQIKGGIAKQRLEELNGVEKQVYSRLKEDPAAVFSLDDVDNLEAKIMKQWMENTGNMGSANFDAARGLLKREKERLIKMVKYEKAADVPKGPISDDPLQNFTESLKGIGQKQEKPRGFIPFEAMERFKRNLQDIGYDAAGNDLQIRGAAEIRSSAHVFRDALREKADQIGAQDYLDVKDSQASILTAYNNLRKVATEKTIHKAYLGNDDVSKQIVQRQVEELDSVLGTNLKNELETGRLQQLVTQAYRKDADTKRTVMQTVKNVGNSLVKGSVVGTTYGYATGMSPKIAGAIGGTFGAVKEGANALKKTPLDQKLKQATTLATEAGVLDAPDTVAGTLKTLAPRTAGARSARQEMSDMPEEKDELDGFDTSAFDDLELESLMNGNEQQDAGL